MPIFVARQWVRHRTANINEYSLRYSEARDEFYMPDPEHIQFQSALNKQGRMGEVPIELKQKVLDSFKEISERSFAIYSELNEAGVARELARSILPVNLYTEWYWKNDLHNLLHFVGLRSDSHAQYEIRVFSDAMAESVKAVAPFAWEAYQDYVVNGMRFSRIEQSLLENKFQVSETNLSELRNKNIANVDWYMDDKLTHQYKDITIEHANNLWSTAIKTG